MYGPKRYLEFTNSVSGKILHAYISEEIELEKWYNIEIEQKEGSGKVRIAITRSILNIYKFICSEIVQKVKLSMVVGLVRTPVESFIWMGSQAQ